MVRLITNKEKFEVGEILSCFNLGSQSDTCVVVESRDNERVSLWGPITTDVIAPPNLTYGSYSTRDTLGIRISFCQRLTDKDPISVA